jgi:hypothetical protein
MTRLAAFVNRLAGRILLGIGTALAAAIDARFGLSEATA